MNLTPLELADAEAISAALAAPELYTFIGGRPSSPAELRVRYARMLAGPPAGDAAWLNWVIRLRHGEHAVGTVQATVEWSGRAGPRAELAWVVGLPWQGHGYAREAVIGVAEFLRGAGVDRLVAWIAPGHAASAAVARATGMSATSQQRDGEIRWCRCPAGSAQPK